MSQKKRIGIVGVGRMGANMARRLKDQSFLVSAVYDVRQESALELSKELQCSAAPSLSELTRQCDVVITVVSDDAAMFSIFSLEGDSLLQNADGKVFINCATVSPEIHIEVTQRAGKVGARVIEACMASSITQARQGSLYLMCAGDQSAFEEVQDVLKALSSSLRFIGKAGEAAKVKALVNMVMNINTAGLAEGLGLGAALGLDLTLLREVFSRTGANSRVLETDGADMQQREHECYFSAAHAAKDSGIALDLAKKLNVEVPLASATKQQYDKLVRLGLGGLDKSGVAELTFPGRIDAKKPS
jgi:3-hydroxyisobutyrate dehydrogenase